MIQRVPPLPQRALALAGLGVCLLALSPNWPGWAASGRALALFGASAAVVWWWLRRQAQLDTHLLAPVLTLGSIGLILLLRLDPELALKQSEAWCLGLVLFAAVSCSPPDFWWAHRYIWLALGFILLLATLPFGVTSGGARAWLSAWGYHLQPSELFKPILVLFLAGYLVKHRRGLTSSTHWHGLPLPVWQHVGPLLCVWLLGLAILVFQRDLGTGLILFGLCVSLTYLASGQVRYLAFGLLMLGAGTALSYALFTHVQVRFFAWLHPNLDPYGVGFQTLRGVYALRSGGLVGTGWGRGLSTSLVAAPSDYALAAIAEQLGWLGVLACFALLAALLLGAFARAAAAPTPEGLLTACGIGLWFTWQAILVSGGIVRLWPLTGVTFPFLSYGGSSLLAGLFGLGLINALARRAPEGRG